MKQSSMRPFLERLGLCKTGEAEKKWVGGEKVSQKGSGNATISWILFVACCLFSLFMSWFDSFARSLNYFNVDFHGPQDGNMLDGGFDTRPLAVFLLVHRFQEWIIGG